VHVLIPTIIQQNPHINSIIFTSPDSGCVEAPYAKFNSLWHNKVIVNNKGQHVRIRVLNKTQFVNDLKDSEFTFYSPEPVVEVIFINTALLGTRWKDYKDTSKAVKDLLPPHIVIVDEIQYAMGTPSASTIREDQGRTNNDYDPQWLPLLKTLASYGTKVLGFTGTPTKSQCENTLEGALFFNHLPPMTRDKDNVAFVDGWTSPSPDATYNHSTNTISTELQQLHTLLSKIDSKTWEAAKELNITPRMPGGMFKFGYKDSANSVPWKSSYNQKNEKIFKAWCATMQADYGIANTIEKIYQKTGPKKYIYPYRDNVGEIITLANDPVNFSTPVFLSVVRQGNMGWDIPRLKYVSVLTHPTGKDVTISQRQLMARANRLPFENMHSHSDMANKIAALDISLEQRKLLAEYVVFMCSMVVFFSRESKLMYKAYREFKQDTYSSVEGHQLYMDAIDNYVPATNKTTLPTGRFAQGYIAGGLNQLYKKHHCEACMEAGSVDPSTGKTLCEVSAKKVREFERGAKFTDDEWAETWFHTLAVDHLNGDRTDYRPENLKTRCPTNNGVKTYDAKDYLNKYDSNGKKANGS
jgi:hypothetical protein